jgi:signal transduction histidine kinase/ligand-binding sensor domain-containing protein
LDPALDVSQYAHTSWKVRDGFVAGAIGAVAQTPDGYLWLGTEYGLVRFDGVRAVIWHPPADKPLPSSWITSLLVARDGTMWIGTFKGLVSWKGEAVTEYPQLAGKSISTLIEDRRGTIWAAGTAATRGALCAVDARAASVNCFGDDGMLGGFVGPVFEDSAGVLWVGANNGLWRWAPGPPKRYADLANEQMALAILEVDHRALLIATRAGLRQVIDGRLEESPVSGGLGKANWLLRDRDGGLWIGTYGAGLTHVHQGRTDRFVQADGLSGDFVDRLFEDREGNIWVATTDGLDRLRELAVSTLSVKQDLSSNVNSVLGAADGGLWVGRSDGLDRWRDGRIGRNLRLAVRFLVEDLRRRLWIATDRELGFVENGRFEAIRGVPGGQVRDMTVDRDGAIWMAHQDLGLFRMHDDRGVESIRWSELGRKDFAAAVAADPAQGGVWLGFYLGGLAYFADGRIRTSYAASDGLGGGAVNDLHFDPGGSLWAGTDGGLSRVKGTRITTLTSRNGLPCDGVHWMREDDTGAIWLNTACGLLRVARAELDAWAAASDAGRGADQQINVTAFDASDGVRSQLGVGGYGPKVAKSADGRLWFRSADGVSVIDPQHLPFNRLAPPVHIEQITADRKSYDVAAQANHSVRLPPSIRDLQIDYTALSLVAPEKMRFRYQLEGWDRDWQEVGTRRQAFYNNLPPRSYRFRVTASNNSGVWNETGAALDFSIAPAYYQTSWFWALLGSMILALAWAAHWIRLRVVQTHEREISALNERLMKAQEQERIRIAGELHDGVMQQMLSMTMMLGTAKRRMDDLAKARATIDQIQEKLIQVGTDIRRLSHGLHPPMLQEGGLPAALRAYCEQFSAASGVAVTCECDDSARELSRGAALALFRVLQEALGNAAKHARATRVTVGLTRTDGMVSLTISDDGVGFEPARLGSSGGLGLVMMRERATQLNGTFEFESAPGRGTTIRVVIPFR